MSEPSEAVSPRQGPGGPCLDRSVVDGMRGALRDDSHVVELAGSFLRDTPSGCRAASWSSSAPRDRVEVAMWGYETGRVRE